MTILITGGAGYIGSHTCIKLLQAGYDVVVFDNFSNSHPEALRRVEQITGRKLSLVQGDILDRIALRNTFENHSINAVVHFAGLKAVGESEAQPIKYYDNNVSGSVALFEEMGRAGVKTVVFSSSATVYGDPGFQQYCEDTPLAPVNVYGRTKLIVENILLDIKKSQPSWRIAVLRYFNPVGAHVSGMIGEDPVGMPNNLMPFIAQVAVGKRKKLHVFGGDYPTPDGTGRRDYIHVEDLAAGHLAALNKLMDSADDPQIVVNLGTGRPYSVLEMIYAFEKASKRSVAFEIVDRRAGDLAEYYAKPTLAKNIFGWEAQLGLDRMCVDTWRWQSKNPEGYK
ncbi:UDP-glucose 4-epimerase GalE [Planktomarina temperata]|nr:UDP-glucose 4-epimerase GalE [Planktomarina temperata]